MNEAVATRIRLRFPMMWLAAASFGLDSCNLHDTEIPLRNLPPAIDKSASPGPVHFPDSISARLTVSDPNRDPVRVVPESWPGGWNYHPGQEVENLELYLPGGKLGRFEGTLQVEDVRGGEDTLSYSFLKTFSGFGVNPGTGFWKTYDLRDDSLTAWEPPSSRPVRFTIGRTAAADSGNDSLVGANSLFGLGGNFRGGITLTMDDSADGMSAGFFLSPSADPLLRPGEVFGAVVSVKNGMMEETGVNFAERPATKKITGVPIVKIRFAGSEAEFLIETARSPKREPFPDPIRWDTLALVRNPRFDAVADFLHLHLRFLRPKPGAVCSWSDFYIEAGELSE